MLDYFKIESCQNLQLHPYYISMCKEFFIKDSSLDLDHKQRESHCISGTLRKLKITNSDQELVNRLLLLLKSSLQELEIDGIENIQLFRGEMTRLEKITIPSLELRETKGSKISELYFSDIPYVNTRQVSCRYFFFE